MNAIEAKNLSNAMRTAEEEAKQKKEEAVRTAITSHQSYTHGRAEAARYLDKVMERIHAMAVMGLEEGFWHHEHYSGEPLFGAKAKMHGIVDYLAACLRELGYAALPQVHPTHDHSGLNGFQASIWISWKNAT